MKRLSFLSIGFAVSLTSLTAVANVDPIAKKFIIIGGETAPFYQPGEKKNMPGGVAGTFLKNVFLKPGLLNDSSPEIIFEPWKRAQMTAENTEYSIIPLAKTKEREIKYAMVGRLYIENVCAWRMKSSAVHVSNLDELHKARVVVTAGSSHEQKLMSEWGFKDLANVISAKESNIRSVQLLFLDRADAFIDTGSVVKAAVKQAGEDQNKIECGVTLGKNDVYIMTSRKSPEAFVKAIRTVLDVYKKTDDYKQLLAEYGVEAE